MGKLFLQQRDFTLHLRHLFKCRGQQRLGPGQSIQGGGCVGFGRKLLNRRDQVSQIGLGQIGLGCELALQPCDARLGLVKAR